MLHTCSYRSCAFNDLLSIAGVVGICQQGNPPALVEGAHCCYEYTKASGEALSTQQLSHPQRFIACAGWLHQPCICLGKVERGGLWSRLTHQASS